MERESRMFGRLRASPGVTSAVEACIAVGSAEGWPAAELELWCYEFAEAGIPPELWLELCLDRLAGGSTAPAHRDALAQAFVDYGEGEGGRVSWT